LLAEQLGSDDEVAELLEEAFVVCAADAGVDGFLCLVNEHVRDKQGAPRTEQAVWMRAMEPWRAWMRSGCGSRSLILDCSVDGPRGAKLCGKLVDVDVSVSWSWSS
jgi:hypothetical protein